VFAGTSLAFGMQHFALLNLVFVGVWLLLVRAIGREHRKLVPIDRETRAA
jgi:hypothetical protein